MARKQGTVPPAPVMADLLGRGVARERALLAVRIGQLRVSRGWTHHGLGQRVGSNGTYLRQIENGERNPGLDLLVRLARVFKLKSIEQLFGTLPTEDVL